MVSTNPMKISIMQAKTTLPAEGYVRLSQIIGPTGPIPVSRSSWWAGVKSGKYPPSLQLGPRTTVWRVDSIRALTVRTPRTPGATTRLKNAGGNPIISVRKTPPDIAQHPINPICTLPP